MKKIKKWLFTRYLLRAINDILRYSLNYIILNIQLLPRNSVIYPAVKIIGSNRIKLGRDVAIRENTYLLAPENGFIHIGNDVFIGMFCVLDGTGGITIGDGVGLGPHACIYAQSHNLSDIGARCGEQGFHKKGVKIEDNVLIGSHAVILDGVTVGEGTFVGAGSVVTHDIPKFSIAAGVPAKVIRSRRGTV